LPLGTRFRSLLLTAPLWSLSGCGLAEGPAPTSPAPTARPAGETAAAAADPRPVVLFVGTSLTAGLGLDPDRAFPALIQRKIVAAGLAYRVVNAGLSGETSAGALRRIDWLLSEPAAVLVLETGANDGLRGQDPAGTRANIEAILDRALEQRPPPRLVLIAMEALPNYGPEYAERFRAIFPEVAREKGATLVPFPLEGVAGAASLNQADGIHPTEEGHRRIADAVWRVLATRLEER
jgi:acyl-CoA thioesterase I